MPQVRSTSRPLAPTAATETQPAGRQRREARTRTEATPYAALEPSPRPSASSASSALGAASPATSVQAPPTDARAAVIIDDCGNNNATTRAFVEAPAPVTLAILPHLTFSRQIAREARAHQKGVMLHFPMEASGGQNPGPGTLRIAMSEAQKQRTIEENLDAVPELEGVNNHEGSLATTDPATMTLVLAAVRKRGLFWVDSYTTPDSCAPDVASSLRLPFAQRDIFLDNEDDLETIKENFRRLIHEASTRGTAVGIGHARANTATAFTEMIPAFEEAGVRLVLVRELTRVPQAVKEEKR